MTSVLASLLTFAAAGAVPALAPREECHVLATVARDELSLVESLAPPLQPGASYLPVCNWTALGLKGFATSTAWPNGRLIFYRPLIHEREASVRYTIVYGSRAGGMYDCNLVKRHSRWRVTDCYRKVAM